MQILDVNGDGGKEIVNFRTSSFASLFRLQETSALDIQVAWMEGGKIWSKSKTFVVFKSLRLPIPPCPVMKMVQHFQAKVLMTDAKRFFVVPFIATVQDVNFLNLLLSRCVEERDKAYPAIFEPKRADPNSWQFLGKVPLR